MLSRRVLLFALTAAAIGALVFGDVIFNDGGNNQASSPSDDQSSSYSTTSQVNTVFQVKPVQRPTAAMTAESSTSRSRSTHAPSQKVDDLSLPKSSSSLSSATDSGELATQLTAPGILASTLSNTLQQVVPKGVTDVVSAITPDAAIANGLSAIAAIGKLKPTPDEILAVGTNTISQVAVAVANEGKQAERTAAKPSDRMTPVDSPVVLADSMSAFPSPSTLRASTQSDIAGASSAGSTTNSKSASVGAAATMKHHAADETPKPHDTFRGATSTSEAKAPATMAIASDLEPTRESGVIMPIVATVTTTISGSQGGVAAADPLSMNDEEALSVTNLRAALPAQVDAVTLTLPSKVGTGGLRATALIPNSERTDVHTEPITSKLRGEVTTGSTTLTGFGVALAAAPVSTAKADVGNGVSSVESKGNVGGNIRGVVNDGQGNHGSEARFTPRIAPIEASVKVTAIQPKDDRNVNGIDGLRGPAASVTLTSDAQATDFSMLTTGSAEASQPAGTANSASHADQKGGFARWLIDDRNRHADKQSKELLKLPHKRLAGGMRGRSLGSHNHDD